MSTKRRRHSRTTQSLGQQLTSQLDPGTSYLCRSEMPPTPAPGYNLAPPKVTRESPKFSIPQSVLDAPPFPLDSTTFAIKASIGETEIFSHEQVAPGHEINQSLFCTKMRIASVTKLFTALSILLSDDQIGWEDPITKHVHGLDEEVYGEVTISALASHTSGLGRFVRHLFCT